MIFRWRSRTILSFSISMLTMTAFVIFAILSHVKNRAEEELFQRDLKTIQGFLDSLGNFNLTRRDIGVMNDAMKAFLPHFEHRLVSLSIEGGNTIEPLKWRVEHPEHLRICLVERSFTKSYSKLDPTPYTFKFVLDSCYKTDAFMSMITISTTAVFFALFFVVILVYLMQKFGVETDLQKLSSAISRAGDFHPQFRNVDFQEIFDAWKTLRTIDASDIELGARQIAHSLEDEVRPYLSMVPNKEAWSRFIQIQARIIEDLRSNGLKGVASRAVIFTESEAIPDILEFMKQFFILHPSLMLKGKAPELARINRQALLMAFQNLSTNFRNHSNMKKTSIEIIFSKSDFHFVAHQKLNLLELLNLKRCLFLKRGIYLPTEKRNRSKGIGIIYLALERLRASYTLELNARESVLIHDILVPFQDMLHESLPKISSEKLAVFGQVSGTINVDFVTSNIKELELRNKELPFRKIFFSRPIPDEAWEWLLPGQVSEVLESEVEAVIREFRGDRK